MANSGRRLRRIEIAEHYIAEIVNRPGDPNNTLRDWIETPLPGDMRVVFVRQSDAQPGIVAFVESASFDDVPLGEQVPLFDVTYRRHHFEKGVPTQYEMMRQLGDALGHERVARPESPEQVWNEYLSEVRSLSRADPFQP